MNTKILGWALTLVISTSPLAAQEVASTAADVAAVRPFIHETTILVVRADPARVAMPDITSIVQSLPAPVQSGYKRWAAEAQSGLEHVRRVTGGQAVYATIGIPLSSSHWPAFVFFKATPAVNAESLQTDLKLSQPAQLARHEGYYVVSPVTNANVAELLAKSAVSPRDGLEAAFDAAANYPIQILLLPPAYLHRAIEETMTQLPAQLGGGSSSVLTEGVRWAALGVDTAAMRAELTIQSASDQAARALAEHLPRLVQGLAGAWAAQELPAGMEVMAKTLLGLLRPEVMGSRVIVRMDGGTMLANVGLLAGIANSLAGSVERREDVLRMKQILLGLHNFHDTYASFPPAQAARDEQGQSQLSWRVHILPFVDQQGLYSQFHLNEPWDSPHNKTLLEKMPDIYACDSGWSAAPDAVKPGHTTILAPVGDDTVFGGTKPTRLADIRDGTSNTVVLVKVTPELAVPWTAPADYQFDPGAPAKGLSVGSRQTVLVGLADGSVLELRADVDAGQLLPLFTKSGGELVDLQRLGR